MDYYFSVRGWMELSWPDADFEGVDETTEEHAAKVKRVHEFLTTSLSPKELQDPPENVDREELYKAGWSLPQNDLGGTEYLFYGADVSEPAVVMELIKGVLAIDPFADGYFSTEGEDGEQYRQWLIKGGKVYTRHHLFPDFESEDSTGYSLFFSASS